MARLLLTVQQILPKYPTTPLVANSADFVWTAAGADFVDGVRFPLTGQEVVLIRNDNAGAQTVTVEGVVDPYNRVGPITTYSVGIGEYAAFPAMALTGWAQTSRELYLTASAADVMFAIVRLPR